MNEIGTPYDDVYRTLLQECKTLIIPVINEIFKTEYTGEEIIQAEENEIFISQQDNVRSRITDSSFSIQPDYASEKKYYHLECQSTADGSMILRMYEYDAQIALRHSELTEGVLTVRFPESAVIFLRHNKNTPDVMRIRIHTRGGSVSYEVPALKIKEYDINTIFERKLLFLIPFYIFTYEDSLSDINDSGEKLLQLKMEYSGIVARLDKMCDAGIINEYTKKTICQMSEKVVEGLARRYEKVKEGVVSVMGGKVLEYEAKTIMDQGRREGRKEGIKEGIKEGRKEGRVDGRVELLKELGKDDEYIKEDIMRKFILPETEAEKYLN